MKREALGHTKMKRLCRRLNIPRWQAVGIMESLWHLTARECPRGDIGKLSDEDIALGIEWEGDPSALVDALLSSGWVDPVERLAVHDWHEHADDAVQSKIARARLLFVGDHIPKVTKLGKAEREEAQKFYRRTPDVPPTRHKKIPAADSGSLPEPLPEPEPLPVKNISAPNGAILDFAAQKAWLKEAGWRGIKTASSELIEKIQDIPGKLLAESLNPESLWMIQGHLGLFQEFWEEYRLLRGEDEKRARIMYFEKVKIANLALHERIIQAVLDQKPHLLKTEKDFRPLARNWLRDERWNDTAELSLEAEG